MAASWGGFFTDKVAITAFRRNAPRTADLTLGPVSAVPPNACFAPSPLWIEQPGLRLPAVHKRSWLRLDPRDNVASAIERRLMVDQRRVDRSGLVARRRDQAVTGRIECDGVDVVAVVCVSNRQQATTF